MEGAGLVTPLGGVSGDGMGAVATTTACAADAAADTLSVSSVIRASEPMHATGRSTMAQPTSVGNVLCLCW